ncbi:LANO_0C03268g1_1 [Lachancea nothofagi CBS 11611]|uniref:LANO_0C03268g1_1 n=1 Tax=Lachancea nothofagi CBS 11611 TaxID=1266666 RepID=A0A1G4J634_9SACH|nr:LANO_0C03268g1_1 [Lachancea nothofagi CBS 11611]
MVDIGPLADKVLEYLAERVDTNYRIAVIVVGPPGSGKSTISEKLCKEINARFRQYLQKRSYKTQLLEATKLDGGVENFCEQIPILGPNARKKLESGLFDHVEDLNYTPHRFKDDACESQVITGRGGLPNSIRVSKLRPERSLGNDINIAQIVPMDGFHLSRKHLDHFSDSAEAHKRRGSPLTFDSNNYLQLCRLLAKSCQVKPSLSTDCGSHLFDKLSSSFSKDVPSINIPGFDHARKDPTTDEHCIDAFTRIIVMEGLYLLLNEENWKEIYPVFKETHAVIIWKLDSDVDLLEQRVAQRHLAAGLAPTLEAGVERFRMNDLPNAMKIKEQSLDADDIVIISND